MSGQFRMIQTETIPDGYRRIAEGVEELVAIRAVLVKWREAVLSWVRDRDHIEELRHPQDFLPLPLALTVGEKYALLGAIRDISVGRNKGIERIRPDDDDDPTMAFDFLMATLFAKFRTISTTDWKRLDRWLSELRDELQPLIDKGN